MWRLLNARELQADISGNSLRQIAFTRGGFGLHDARTNRNRKPRGGKHY
jgi:hypothetical protein